MSEVKIKKSNRIIPAKTKGELNDLVRECNIILKKSSDDIVTLRKKGIYLYDLCYYEPDQIKNTTHYLDRVLQVYKKDKEVLKCKAELLLRIKDLSHAIECFDEVLKIDPQDSEAWWGKGAVTLTEKKPYSAISFFDKSLELDPLDARTWMQKGFALSARGETWDQALECFTKSLEINSDDPLVWRGKGAVFQKKNDLDNAIFNFDKALSLDPSDWESLMLKGFALVGKHDFKNAIKCFDESLTIKHNNIETLNGKASALFYSNQYEQALKIYEGITQIDPKYIGSWIQRGFCYLKLNDEKKALYNFEMALKINPDDITAQKEKNKLIDKKNESIEIASDKTVQSLNQDSVITVKELFKSFRIHHEKNDSLFSIISNSLSKKNYETIDVLKNISFNLNRGEMLGIIGGNGNGKTTLLKILAGILKADKGEIKINGVVAPLLQMGIGFNGELTAKENIILSGMLSGFSKSEIKNKVEDIIKFAELEKFADTKIKNFSTGMHARLAFSTAIQIDPDILLVDEVLAVGDINFVKKSYKEFLSFRERGKSIIFVSHSLEHIKNLCDRVMILEAGEIKIIGNPDQVVEHYIQMNN